MRVTKVGGHPCPRPGCDRRIPNSLFCCPSPECWESLPANVRAMLGKTARYSIRNYERQVAVGTALAYWTHQKEKSGAA